VSRLSTRNEIDLQPETLAALAPARVSNKLADVYLQFASSEEALRAYLHMERSVREGSLTAREVEAVKLWMSQQTGCDYCLSVHTFKAGKAGLSSAEQLAIRQGEPVGCERIDCLIALTAALFRKPGKLADRLLEHARKSGFTDQNLVDLTLVMSTIFFTNITNHINDSQSPLPPAPTL